jgi:hypothetical protein
MVSWKTSHRPPPRPPRIADGAERIRKVRDDEAPAVPEKRNDVVAHFAGMRMARQVLIGERDELQFLATVDRIDAVSGRETLARFDFDKHERSSALRDEIDFAPTQLNVARHDAISAQTVEPRRAPFTALAE